MLTIILMSTGAYFVFSGVFLIALLRSAACTSLDWSAYSLLADVRLLDVHPYKDRVHMAAGTAPPCRVVTGQRVTQHTPARPS